MNLAALKVNGPVCSIPILWNANASPQIRAPNSWSRINKVRLPFFIDLDARVSAHMILYFIIRRHLEYVGYILFGITHRPQGKSSSHLRH